MSLSQSHWSQKEEAIRESKSASLIQSLKPTPSSMSSQLKWFCLAIRVSVFNIVVYFTVTQVESRPDPVCFPAVNKNTYFMHLFCESTNSSID